MEISRFEKAIELFDNYNKQDPNRVVWEGKEYPAEYFYALQVHRWVKELEPQAGESLLLASRSQHIGRWEVPRSTYPEGKAGYLKWRSDLAKYHSQKAGELMFEVGYEEEEVLQVQRILMKKQLKADPEVQTMENALCLVFLEFQFADFIKDYDDEKLIRIVRKTWAKMSEPGHAAALKLNWDGRSKELVEKALA